jgi:hypothetical protein
VAGERRYCGRQRGSESVKERIMHAGIRVHNVIIEQGQIDKCRGDFPRVAKQRKARSRGRREELREIADHQLCCPLSLREKISKIL